MKTLLDKTVSFWKRYLLKKRLAFVHTTIWLLCTMLAGCVLLPESEQEVADTNTSVNDIGLSTAELTQELEALRESQKKLQRLSELEGDLMLLLKELSKQPKIEEGPNGYRPDLSTETVEPDEFFSAQPKQPLVIPNNAKKNKVDKTETASESYVSSSMQSEPPKNTWSNKELESLNSPPKETVTPQPRNTITLQSPASANYVLWLGFFVSEQAAMAGSRRLEEKINFGNYGLSVEVVENANTRGQYHGLILTPFQTLRQASSFCTALSRYGQYCKVQRMM